MGYGEVRRENEETHSQGNDFALRLDIDLYLAYNLEIMRIDVRTRGRRMEKGVGERSSSRQFNRQPS